MELVTETTHRSVCNVFTVREIERNEDGHPEESKVLTVSVGSYPGGLRIDFDPVAFSEILIYAGDEKIYSKGE